jgi:hypothetical protein
MSSRRQPKNGEQNHRSQPAMAGEFLAEIQSVNTAIAGGWVQTFATKLTLPIYELDSSDCK